MNQLRVIILVFSLHVATPVVLAATDSPLAQTAGPSPVRSNSKNVIEADEKIVMKLRDLGSEHSFMLTKVRQLLAKCSELKDVKFFLNQLFGTNEFDDCDDIDKLVNQLSREHIDTFNVYALGKVAEYFKRDDVGKLVEDYEVKKESFLKETKISDFMKAVASKVAPALSKGKVELTIKIHRRLANDRILKDMEELATEAFGDHYKFFVRFHAIRGSVILLWHVPERLCEELEQLAFKNTAMLRAKGVDELTIKGNSVLQKVTFANTNHKLIHCSQIIILIIHISDYC